MESLVKEKLNELMAMGCLQPDDPKFEFFKTKIVPSVVNEWISPSGRNSHSYRCPFDRCAILVSRSKSLERHLREQHYNEMPLGVFGKQTSFQCIPCDLYFRRYEHLRQHLEGRKHLKTLIGKGLANKNEIAKWKDICQAERELRELNTDLNGSEGHILEDTEISSFHSSSDSSLYISNPSTQNLTNDSFSPLLKEKITSTPIIKNIDKPYIKHQIESLDFQKSQEEIKISKRNYNLINLKYDDDELIASDDQEEMFFHDENFIHFLNRIETETKSDMENKSIGSNSSIQEVETRTKHSNESRNKMKRKFEEISNLLEEEIEISNKEYHESNLIDIQSRNSSLKGKKRKQNETSMLLESDLECSPSLPPNNQFAQVHNKTKISKIYSTNSIKNNNLQNSSNSGDYSFNDLDFILSKKRDSPICESQEEQLL